MPFKDKERQKEYHKQYRLKNKDKLKENIKEYQLKNKDKLKENREKNKDKLKEYQLKNKDKLKEYHKQYHLKNKDKATKYYKEYNKEYNKTEKRIKLNKISNWKTYGLIDSDNDNYEKTYQRYIDTTNCDLCNIELTDGTNITAKHMEHDHKTGLFRNIVCPKCNNKIKVIETPCKSNTGIKNIYYNKRSKLYKYDKTTNGVKVHKTFKELHHSICYSIVQDLITDLS